MTSLLDIGPLTEEVEIRGTKLNIQGLTAGHLFQLFAEFPEMRKILELQAGQPAGGAAEIGTRSAGQDHRHGDRGAQQQGGRGQGQDHGRFRSGGDPVGRAAAVLHGWYRPFRRSGDKADDDIGGIVDQGLASILELNDNIACAIQRLIANGHPRESAWGCTPRQLVAWCGLIERERMRVMAQDYISLRNAQAETGPAREYHGELLALASGKKA